MQTVHTDQRKVHTDQRASLNHSIIVSLMSLKFNCDSYCFDLELPEELLSKSKKANQLHVSQSENNCIHDINKHLIDGCGKGCGQSQVLFSTLWQVTIILR